MMNLRYFPEILPSFAAGITLAFPEELTDWVEFVGVSVAVISLWKGTNHQESILYTKEL